MTLPALTSVSSHDSQLPHGVTPPAQLLMVPEMPTHSERLWFGSFCGGYSGP
jgi:hypothetical protein